MSERQLPAVRAACSQLADCAAIGHQTERYLRRASAAAAATPAELLGGVVHLLDARFGLERGEDLDLVVLGQLLENVSEAFVVERGGDLDPARVRQVLQRVGQVGGAQLSRTASSAAVPCASGSPMSPATSSQSS